MKNLFVIILRYIVKPEEMDIHYSGHVKFLETHYKSGHFITSGKQMPEYGGVIFTNSPTRKEVEKIIEKDPFFIYDLAEYQIFEFKPTRYSNEFQKVVNKDE